MIIQREFAVSQRRSQPPEPVPRVARLMALAIRFDELIRDGVVANQAELARRGGVTPARVSQIMNLMVLAPEIQEQVLFGAGVCERDLRRIVQEVDWDVQRGMWEVD